MLPISRRPMKLPYRILVLDDDSNTVSGIVEMLRDAGYQATGTGTYDAARRLLGLASYDLLITDVRLRGFNGLNLVRQCAGDHPDMSVIIMTGFDQSMMEMEAARYGATFLRKPIVFEQLMTVVSECLARVRGQRRWLRKRVAAGFRVVANGQPAAVVDVSYGGLRLEMTPTDGLPDSFDVEVAAVGLNLPVDRVWVKPSPDGTTLVCGAALAADSTPEARAWRAIVDRLPA